MKKTLLMFMLGALAATAQTTPTVPPETKAENDARMAWFREARFGMFIHWGLYAVPAGEWNGKKYGGGVEWIQSFAQIPPADYQPLLGKFNPVKYDAAEWVRIAKDAGMKYIVITSKHHDGFCLWDSAQTGWDVGSTPYGKDLLKPLAEACEANGIKLCFYHSIMDWHHPDYGTKAPWRGNASSANPDMDKFTAYMKAQLDELLAYKPGILWFDGEWEAAWTHERGVDLYHFLRARDPQLIINNRVDKGRKGMTGFNSDSKFKGDFCTPEQEIPASGVPGVDWESCMTMNKTWGYSAHDQDWKSAETLIRNLVDIVSKGGNYLLNVGPTGEGLIPDASVQRLKRIGEWMKVNAEAIHGTAASPFPKAPAWGRCTRRTLPNGNTMLYLHVFDWPADGKLVVDALDNVPVNARLLAEPGDALEVRTAPFTIQLPASAPDKVASVIAVEVKGPVQLR